MNEKIQETCNVNKQDDWFIIFVIWLQKDLSIYLLVFILSKMLSVFLWFAAKARWSGGRVREQM